MNYPTDLGPQEQLWARARLADLAEQFTAKGILRTPVWREVFEQTWRHPYVPGYYPDKDAPCVLSVDPAQRGGWLDAVYSDTTLITKVMPVPLSRVLRPATGTIYTSSSTLPSLVLEMLEELDVTDGHRVLEIGTGTGYNTALLCERLGSAQVTSVECASAAPNGSGTASRRPQPSGTTKADPPTNASASPPQPITSTSGTTTQTVRAAGHCKAPQTARRRTRCLHRPTRAGVGRPHHLRQRRVHRPPGPRRERHLPRHRDRLPRPLERSRTPSPTVANLGQTPP